MKVKSIIQEVQIAATPMQVYDALTNPKKHTEFTGSEANGTDKVNAKFTAWDGYAFGKNLELVKGKKIVQEWQTSEWPEDASPSLLTITLAPQKSGTLLKMVHSNIPEEQAQNYADGWIEYYWNPLKKYFSKKGKK